MGVRVNRNKKFIAEFTALAIFACGFSAITASESSFARESQSSPGSKPAIHPTPSSPGAKGSFASTSSVAGCSKTDSVGHSALPVGVPNVNAPKVDRTFTLNTNCGQIVFKAFGLKAPLTIIAMTTLAKAGYFDHSLCHRLTTAGLFVLQCGDPTALGTGRLMSPEGNTWGPPDENLPTVAKINDYPAGTIAMANSGLPNSGGSQFFIVYKDTTLPPSYSIWGVVTQGLDTVKRVAAAGVSGGGTDGKPNMTIAIESVTVK